MKEGQKGIYWLAADNKTAAASAPFVEGLAKRDLEVLFLTDAIDEVAFQNLAKYGEHNLVDVSREQVDLGDSAETAEKVLIFSSFSLSTIARHTRLSNVVWCVDAWQRHCSCLWASLCLCMRVSAEFACRHST